MIHMTRTETVPEGWAAFCRCLWTSGPVERQEYAYMAGEEHLARENRGGDR